MNILKAAPAFIILLNTINGNAQNTYTVSSGTHMVARGDVHIVLGSGTLTNNGTITDTSGTLMFTGAVVAGGSGTYNLNHLKTDHVSATSVLNTTTGVSNLVTVANGTLNANGNLILRSTQTRTAGIAAGSSSGGYISGNVVIEKYIPGLRAFRFFVHPFSSSIALSQLTDDIDITGSGGSTNGFTTTQTNAPSAFWWDETAADNSTAGNNPGWTAFTHTNGSGANAWDKYELARILVRGAPGEGLNGGAYTPSPVTINLAGAVNQGDQAVPVTKGPGSNFVSCANPFPSAVQMSGVSTGAGVGSSYYVWNTNKGGKGGYDTYSFGTNVVLPAYCAFFTTATASSVITFEEADKTTATPLGLFKGTSDKNIIKFRLEDSTTYWDDLTIRFNDNAINTFDWYDAVKLNNPSLDFYAFSRDDSMLAIDSRPYKNGEVIQLGLQAYNRYQEYTLQVPVFDIPAGVQIFFYDKYLNVTKEIKQGFEYRFTVNTDSLSQGNNRFSINMKGEPATINIANWDNKIQLVPNPAKNQVRLFLNDITGPVNVQLISLDGKTVYSGKVLNSSVVTIQLTDISNGIYMVHVWGENINAATKLIKQ